MRNFEVGSTVEITSKKNGLLGKRGVVETVKVVDVLYEVRIDGVVHLLGRTKLKLIGRPRLVQERTEDSYARHYAALNHKTLRIIAGEELRRARERAQADRLAEEQEERQAAAREAARCALLAEAQRKLQRLEYEKAQRINNDADLFRVSFCKSSVPFSYFLYLSGRIMSGFIFLEAFLICLASFL